MSYASVKLVEEFFRLHGFLSMQRDDVLLVKNATPRGDAPGAFVLARADLEAIRSAAVKVAAWHTMKFTPAILQKSPEIFHFLAPSVRAKTAAVLADEEYARILVLPGLPAADTLRRESIAYLKERGINHIITFPTVIAGLIERINPRQVYLCETNELIRVLKFYRFFPDRQPGLPFEKR